ncbi:MAG: DUF2721 domain-containing protein, partial [Anaerolineae bacterium]|nr:DUF2721 domain-containing protein [Anaerolineae bacterium]
MVAVFNTQLGRISDRVEMLRGKSHDSPELPQLARRGQLLLFAFACVTLAGILIAAVIAAIFWGFFNLTNLTSVIAVLFLSATLLL